MTENEIATIVVESAIEGHRTLGGPGLLEAVAYNRLFEAQVLTYIAWSTGCRSEPARLAFLRLCVSASLR